MGEIFLNFFWCCPAQQFFRGAKIWTKPEFFSHHLCTILQVNAPPEFLTRGCCSSSNRRGQPASDPRNSEFVHLFRVSAGRPFHSDHLKRKHKQLFRCSFWNTSRHFQVVLRCHLWALEGAKRFSFQIKLIARTAGIVNDMGELLCPFQQSSVKFPPNQALLDFKLYHFFVLSGTGKASPPFSSQLPAGQRTAASALVSETHKPFVFGTDKCACRYLFLWHCGPPQSCVVWFLLSLAFRHCAQWMASQTRRTWDYLSLSSARK